MHSATSLKLAKENPCIFVENVVSTFVLLVLAMLMMVFLLFITNNRMYKRGRGCKKTQSFQMYLAICTV